MDLAEAYGKIDRITRAHENLVLLIFVVILCLISFRYGYLVWTTDNYIGETVKYNFPYADAIFNGIAPYTPGTEMRWEYPPFAYLLMMVPRFFTSDVNVYEVLYVVEVLAFLLVGLFLIRKIAGHFGKNPFPVFVVVALSVYFLDYFIYDRFDVIVAVMVLAASYLLLKKRFGWAIFLIIFGMFVKLYPALLVPIIMIPFLAERKFMSAAKVAVFSLVLCVVFIAPFIMMSPDNVWNFMTYHSDRGLQIESVAASILMFAGMFIPFDYFTENSFGSYNISGSVCDSVASIMMILMLLAILAVYIAYYVHCRCRETNRDFDMLAAFFIIIMVFVVFNKVFSAQYVIWALFLAIPVIMTVDDRKVTIQSWVTCTLLIVLTMWMVNQYDSLLNHEVYGIMVLFIRNLLFVGMMVYGVRYAEYPSDVVKFIHRKKTVSN